MEKLICDCVNEQDEPISGNHVQYTDQNGETIVECTTCGRFLKFTEPQPDVPQKPE